MGTLYLPLKRKMYVLVARGLKKEVYRDPTPYWNKRLKDRSGYYREINDALLTYGRTQRTMRYSVEQIRLGIGSKRLGASGKMQYKIKLGRKIY